MSQIYLNLDESKELDFAEFVRDYYSQDSSQRLFTLSQEEGESLNSIAISHQEFEELPLIDEDSHLQAFAKVLEANYTGEPSMDLEIQEFKFEPGVQLEAVSFSEKRFELNLAPKDAKNYNQEILYDDLESQIMLNEAPPLNCEGSGLKSTSKLSKASTPTGLLESLREEFETNNVRIHRSILIGYF